jgi:predicted transcriptional regulator
LNKDIRQKIYVIIDKLSEARLSQALDFLELLKTKEEIEATNELIDDKAFYNAIKKGLEEIEKGEVFAASEVIEEENEQAFEDLLKASQSSTDFWDNKSDDKMWNNV